MRYQLKSLEYNIVWHCVNSCAACSHMSPVNPPYLVPVADFAESVKAAAAVVEAEAFALLGGEPLLHPDLLELVDIARASGISQRVQVTTNGLLLDRQPDEFWRRIGVLRVTRYPGQVTDEQWEGWKRRCEENGSVFFGGLNAQFYRPIAKAELTESETADRFGVCPWRSHCTTLDRCKLYLCPQALFFPRHLPGFTEGEDGLSLVGATADDVKRYFEREDALRVCRRCSFSEYSPWRQVKRDRWFEESTSHA